MRLLQAEKLNTKGLKSRRQRLRLFFSLDIFKNTRRYIAPAAPIRTDGASAGAQTGCCLKRPLENILRYNVRAEPYVAANSSSAMVWLFFTFPIYVHNQDSGALRYSLVHFFGNPLCIRFNIAPP
ncbi:MAG: hypothetical protein U0I48_01660 [Acutalibacteraceae bacterium]|nr:hypothetical protein [Acutalibacteraceae bacterium]